MTPLDAGGRPRAKWASSGTVGVVADHIARWLRDEELAFLPGVVAELLVGVLLYRGGFRGSFGLSRDVVIAGGEGIGEMKRSHRGRQRGQGTLDEGRCGTAAD